MHLFAPSPSEVLKARYGDRYRWLLLMALMVGVIASIIPATSVNVAIPAMSAYFQVGQERAQWITSSFMMASTIGMLVTPWMLSRFGYRATYAYSIGLLILGGIVGGLSQHFERGYHADRGEHRCLRVHALDASADAPSGGSCLPPGPKA